MYIIQQKDRISYLFSFAVMLCPLVCSNTERVGHNCSHQAGLDSKEKPFQPLLLINQLPTINETSVRQEPILFEGANRVNLYFGFNDVLGVGEKPAVDASQCSHKAALGKGKHLIMRGGEGILDQLISGELSSVGRYLSSQCSKHPFEQALQSFLLYYSF